jgi:hypothetical protein
MAQPPTAKENLKYPDYSGYHQSNGWSNVIE